MAAVARAVAVAGAGAGLADVSDTLSLLLQLHKLIGWDGRHGGGGGGGGGRVRRRSGWRSWLRPVKCTRVWRGPGCGRHTVQRAMRLLRLQGARWCRRSGAVQTVRWVWEGRLRKSSAPHLKHADVTSKRSVWLQAAGCRLRDPRPLRSSCDALALLRDCRCIAGETQPDLTRPCACACACACPR